MSERSLSDWLSDAGDTLDDRGLEYGDPRHNLLRIYKIARLLGIQLRDPADVALLFITTHCYTGYFTIFTVLCQDVNPLKAFDFISHFEHLSWVEKRYEN